MKTARSRMAKHREDKLSDDEIMERADRDESVSICSVFSIFGRSFFFCSRKIPGVAIRITITESSILVKSKQTLRIPIFGSCVMINMMCFDLCFKE